MSKPQIQRFFLLLVAIVVFFRSPTGISSAAEPPADDAASNPPDDSTVEKCPSCQGSGLPDCRKCDNSRKMRRICSTCKGRNPDARKGRGKIRCKKDGCKCGKKNCRTCKGKGYGTKRVIKSGRETYERIPCRSCKRSGRRPCNNCDKTGWLPCKACDTRGFSLEECEFCVGEVRRSCKTCGGKGEIVILLIDPDAKEISQDHGKCAENRGRS